MFELIVVFCLSINGACVSKGIPEASGYSTPMQCIFDTPNKLFSIEPPSTNKDTWTMKSYTCSPIINQKVLASHDF